MVPEQRLRDFRPLGFERRGREGAARATIPVGGVAVVALFAMEVGVDPIAGAALVGLRALVRALPLAACVAPQGGQSGREARRLGAGERGAKLGQGQGGLRLTSRPS